MTAPDLLPFDREMPCPACGIQMGIVGLCREPHPAPPGSSPASAHGPWPEHLHVECPGCGWDALMETAAQAARQAPPDVPHELRGFISQGRLLAIPVRRGRRRAVLGHIASRAFEPDRAYPEGEVNMALAMWHPDVASLRRYLVDEGFMRREAGMYELLPAARWPAA
ncbi:MAG: DUF2087 domain-containing protein [Candidatus Limnocylindrales bacterium]